MVKKISFAGFMGTLCCALLVGHSRPAAANKGEPPRYTLPQLIKLTTDNYPGISAARHEVSMMKRKLFRARWGWVPQGTVKGFLAPSTSVKCLRPRVDSNGRVLYDANGNMLTEPDNVQCVTTSTYDLSTFQWDSILLRLQVELGMPLYTFDKLGSAKRAAEAGVALSQSQVRAVQDKVKRDVTKAYWGLKLAREILYTIKDGRTHLDKALKKIEEELEDGKGDATETDLLRLKSAAVEVDTRTLEAVKLERISKAALATLAGLPGKPFDVDKEVLKLVPGQPLTLEVCRQLARNHRPDVSSLRAAVDAAKAALDLEVAGFYPNILLVGTVDAVYAPGVDRTYNAFYNNPYNTVGAGFGLTVNWNFNLVQQYGKYKEAWAQRRKAEDKQKEALAGIDLEIEKQLIEFDDAQQRLKVTHKSQKTAKSWLVAVSQNIGLGLAEVNELTDALVAYYSARLRYLKAVFDINVGWSELEKAVGAATRKLPPKDPAK